MGNRNSKKSTKCCTIVNIDTKEVFNLTKNELKSQYIYYPISNKIANKALKPELSILSPNFCPT